MRRLVHRLSLGSSLLLSLTFVAPFLLFPFDAQKSTPTEGVGKAGACAANVYSIEKEIALGKQLAQQFEEKARVVDDPVVVEYLNRIGQNLARNSESKLPITIKLIEGAQVNGFALPGGFVYLQTGLILNADTEAELAGAIAHEIALIAARVGICQTTKGDVAQSAAVPLIFIGGPKAFSIYDSGGFLMPMGSLKYARDMQAAADLVGIQYMYKSGYDPAAFVDFLEKRRRLEKRTPETDPGLFSTLPPTEDRLVKSQQEIATLRKRPNYVVTTAEFNNVKKRLAVDRERHEAESGNNRNVPSLLNPKPDVSPPLR